MLISYQECWINTVKVAGKQYPLSNMNIMFTYIANVHHAGWDNMIEGTTELLNYRILMLRKDCDKLVVVINDKLQAINDNTKYLDGRCDDIERKLDKLIKLVDVKIEVMCDNTQCHNDEKHILEGKIAEMKKRIYEIESQLGHDIDGIRRDIRDNKCVQDDGPRLLVF